jgi:protoheme IX farnesyltransferase
MSLSTETIAAPLASSLASTDENLSDRAGAFARPSARASAFVELTKPRINVMVLLTVAIGYVLGAGGSTRLVPLGLAILGAGLVSAGASAWNQLLERHRDERMRRTRNRPLPSGRVGAIEAGVFGTALTLVGTLVLALGAHPLAAWVAAATFVLYVVVYTPMKPRTTLNTAVGAIPGALPPVIGWAAATGTLGLEAGALFLILFLWQFPHFLAIAWLYRDDYAKGGYRMLPIIDTTGGKLTARHATLYAIALVPAGLAPTLVGLAGWFYAAGSLALGLYYLRASWGFWSDPTESTARRLMKASFLYLPAVILLLVLNPIAR